MIDQPEFYVYLHCKPDGTPFYVGKGSKKRARTIDRVHNPHHCHIVAKYGRENIKVELLVCESEDDAYAQEVWWIAMLRAEGFRLCNLNAGGEGGRSPSDETRAKQSEIAKRRTFSAATRAKMAANVRSRPGVNLGRTFTEEHRGLIGIAGLGRKPTEETRAKLRANSVGFKGRKHSPETLAKMALAQQARRAREGAPYADARR